ncbi:MAG: hypothetical protein KGY45_05015 [Hadesarchaea archaeon]|nr:hypothetical protein [Hadesarchaea archaeon]
MKDKAQIFTLDMLFALLLVAALVAASTQAYEIAAKQNRSYSTRYSLERTVNDASEALIKTSGLPQSWRENDNFVNIETPGLAEEGPSGTSIFNALSMRKFESLRMLTMEDNWTNYTDSADSVKELFGGSSKFEIRLIDENTGENIWRPIYPKWDVKSSPGYENSLEVATVKRLVDIREVERENSIENLMHISGPPGIYRFKFRVDSGDLTNRDWYLVVKRHPPGTPQPEVRIWVNKEIQAAASGWDWRMPPDKSPFSMWWHGAGQNPPENDIQVGSNYVVVWVGGRPTPYSIDVSVISLERCSPSRYVDLPPLGTVEVRMWE